MFCLNSDCSSDRMNHFIKTSFSIYARLVWFLNFRLSHRSIIGEPGSAPQQPVGVADAPVATPPPPPPLLPTGLDILDIHLLIQRLFTNYRVAPTPNFPYLFLSLSTLTKPFLEKRNFFPFIVLLFFRKWFSSY